LASSIFLASSSFSFLASSIFLAASSSFAFYSFSYIFISEFNKASNFLGYLLFISSLAFSLAFSLIGKTALSSAFFSVGLVTSLTFESTYFGASSTFLVTSGLLVTLVSSLASGCAILLYFSSSAF
tara:strand:+ start:2569 stop:2946 length:378 start_codon:yes stop_codon:yes gene_type:complete